MSAFKSVVRGRQVCVERQLKLVPSLEITAVEYFQCKQCNEVIPGG